MERIPDKPALAAIPQIWLGLGTILIGLLNCLLAPFVREWIEFNRFKLLGLRIDLVEGASLARFLLIYPGAVLLALGIDKYRNPARGNRPSRSTP